MTRDLGQATYHYLYEIAQKHAQALYDKFDEDDFSTAQQMAIENAIYEALIESAN